MKRERVREISVRFSTIFLQVSLGFSINCHLGKWSCNGKEMRETSNMRKTKHYQNSQSIKNKGRGGREGRRGKSRGVLFSLGSLSHAEVYTLFVSGHE